MANSKELFKKLKIGIAQVPLFMGDKRRNISTLLLYTEIAASKSCDVVILPECPLAGWTASSVKLAAETIPGPYTRALSKLASKNRIAIVSGMEEKEGTRVFNSVVFIGRDGKVLAKHRKINELDIAPVYTRGRTLGVFDFEGIPTGLDICADSWGAEITDTLYLMGARLIFSPSAWAVTRGQEERNIQWIANTYRKRTQGRDLTIVTADSVGPLTQGPWKGRILQGESLITRRGKTLLQGPRNQAALLTYELRVSK